jgi:hypothetical protein
MIIEKGDENMKFDLFTKISLIIIVVLLALNIILPILSSPEPSYAAKNIQYKVINSEEVPRDKENFEKLFNEYGKEGWEFVALELNWGYYIFKR